MHHQTQRLAPMLWLHGSCRHKQRPAVRGRDEQSHLRSSRGRWSRCVGRGAIGLLLRRIVHRRWCLTVAHHRAGVAAYVCHTSVLLLLQRCLLIRAWTAIGRLLWWHARVAARGDPRGDPGAALSLRWRLRLCCVSCISLRRGRAVTVRWRLHVVSRAMRWKASTALRDRRAKGEEQSKSHRAYDSFTWHAVSPAYLTNCLSSMGALRLRNCHKTHCQHPVGVTPWNAGVVAKRSICDVKGAGVHTFTIVCP
jgi:hypothetical protein